MRKTAKNQAQKGPKHSKRAPKPSKTSKKLPKGAEDSEDWNLLRNLAAQHLDLDVASDTFTQAAQLVEQERATWGKPRPGS